MKYAIVANPVTSKHHQLLNSVVNFVLVTNELDFDKIIDVGRAESCFLDD